MHRIKFLKIIIVIFALIFALSLEYEVAWVDQPHYAFNTGIFNFYQTNNGESSFIVPGDVPGDYVHSFGFGGIASVTVNLSSLDQYKNNLTVETYLFILNGNANMSAISNSNQSVIRIGGFQSFETYNLSLMPGFYSIWFFTEIFGNHKTLENITNQYNTTLRLAVSDASVSLPQPDILIFPVYLLMLSEAVTISGLFFFGKKSYLEEVFQKNSKK